MTDNEIIKALECCGKNPLVCHECKYKGKCNRIDCYDYLKRDALDLINRQKANAEGLTYAVKFLNEQLSSAKADAIKEFTERLKENTVTLKVGKQNCRVITVDGIDYLKKEMVGDAE